MAGENLFTCQRAGKHRVSTVKMGPVLLLLRSYTRKFYVTLP